MSTTTTTNAMTDKPMGMLGNGSSAADEGSVAPGVAGNTATTEATATAPADISNLTDPLEVLQASANDLSALYLGNGGNNYFGSSGQDDLIDGGAGIDTVTYSGARAGYSISQDGATGPFTVKDIRGNEVTDGTDTLSGIERLRFADVKLALDLGANQNAGEAALLVGAVMGRGALAGGQKELVGAVLNILDGGTSLHDLCEAAMKLPASVWGQVMAKSTVGTGAVPLASNAAFGSPTATQMASYLLTTVNGSAPSQATLSAAVASITSANDHGDFLFGLVTSAANQTQVNLVGLAHNGLEFF